MSYSGGAGGADLDAINFTDECFPSFVSLSPSSSNNVETESYVL
jgi:hypothetical protein